MLTLASNCDSEVDHMVICIERFDSYAFAFSP